MPADAAPSLLVSRLDLERIEALLEHEDATAHAPLRAELDRAEVREPRDMPDDVITMNSTVCFVDEASGQEREVTLVYPRHAGGSAECVSILAPVGGALLGLRVGQGIDWPVPGGQLRLGVRAIRYQPEASGEYHR